MTRSSMTALVAQAAARTALVALLLAQSGCALFVGGAAVGGLTGAVIATAQPQPTAGAGAAVTVSLDPPRDLTLTGGAAGDTAWVRGARWAVGRVSALGSDTLWLALTEVVGSRGSATFPAVTGPTAVIPREPGVRVRPIARRPSVIGATALGAALGIVATVVGIYVYCANVSCFE